MECPALIISYIDFIMECMAIGVGVEFLHENVHVFDEYH